MPVRGPLNIGQQSFNLYPLVSAQKLRHWQREHAARFRAQLQVKSYSSPSRPVLIGRFGTMFLGLGIEQVRPEEFRYCAAELLQAMRKSGPGKKSELVIDACELAWEAHFSQKRKDGSPYYSHPLTVARTVADWGLSHEAVIAALLHDVLEDGVINGVRINKDFIAARFGWRVAELVDGVTEFGKEPEFKGDKPDDAQIFRKLFEYGSRDLAIMIVKLADRLHNMRTLEYTSPRTQQEKARETLNVYARIADILGLWPLKRELEDRSFQYLEPEQFQRINRLREKLMEQSAEGIFPVADTVKRELARLEVRVEPEFRQLYELEQRMKNREIDPADLTPADIWRLNLVVRDQESCYLALADLHALYRPVQQEIRDFIADPPPNGHRFLLTYVDIPSFGRLLVQIRDHEMFDHYQRGIISRLKEGERLQEHSQTWLNSARGYLNWRGLSTDQIYGLIRAVSSPITVTTPGGEQVELPFGASVLDFARAINEQLFLRARSAVVNGRRVEVTHELKHGDRVEVQTDQSVFPAVEWLDHLVTPNAQKSLRHFLKNQTNAYLFQEALRALETALEAYYLPARELVEAELFLRFIKQRGYPDAQALLLEVGLGKLRAGELVNELRAHYQEELSKLTGPGWNSQPFYVAIETANVPGKLANLVSRLGEMKFNISDIFHIEAAEPEQAVIIIAADLLPSHGAPAAIRHIQTIQVRTIAATIGQVKTLRPETVEGYLREKARRSGI